MYKRGSRIAQGVCRAMRLADSGIKLQNDQLTTGLHDTTIQIRCSNGGVLTILWGDGTSSAVVCNNVLNSYSHTYVATGVYTICIVGTMTLLRDFRCMSQAWIGGRLSDVVGALSPETFNGLHITSTSITGDISALARFVNITSLSLSYTALVGNISAFSGMTAITYALLNTPAFSGDISSLASLPLLTTLYLFGIPALTYTGPTALPAWGGTTWLYSSGLSSAEVDQFLVDLADGCGTTGARVLKLAGTNAARTAASNAAKATLLAAGWTVEVNE